MHLEPIAAVLQIVFVDDRVGRQFSRFADGDYAQAEFEGQRTGEQEAAGLDRRDHVELHAPPGLGESADRLGEPGRVGQQRRDVAKQDARLGEVGNRADEAGDVDHEPEIGSNHMVAGERVTPTNTLGEPFLVRRSEQGCLVDVPQVGLERVLHGGRPLTTGGRGHDGLGARGTTN